MNAKQAAARKSRRAQSQGKYTPTVGPNALGVLSAQGASKAGKAMADKKLKANTPNLQNYPQ